MLALGKGLAVDSFLSMNNRALYEARWIFAILAAAWLLTLALFPLLSIIFALLILFTFYFFRDPQRTPPPGDHLGVSPADGVVTTIDELVEDEFLKTKVKTIMNI